MAQKSKVRSANSKVRVQQSLFGPSPVLENEDPAEFDQWLRRLHADLKPTGISEVALVYDMADADWQVRRWRRIRTCIVEAALPAAIVWVLGMPGELGLRYLRGDQDIDREAYPNINLQEEVKESKARMKARVQEMQEGPTLIPDTIKARVHLEEFELLERVDRMISYHVGQRNRAHRELFMHRAAIAHIHSKRIRVIEDAKYKAIQPRMRR